MSVESFRHYEFGPGEVLKEAKDFLQRVGYQLMKPARIGFAVPDIHAQRDFSNGIHKLFAVVVESLENAEVISAFIKLQAIRAFERENADYVLIMPPVNEYLLIEFLEGTGGQNYLAIKELDAMWWMLNPEERSVWCIIGMPRDRLFEKHFILKQMTFDQAIGVKIMHQHILEEEEED